MQALTKALGIVFLVTLTVGMTACEVTDTSPPGTPGTGGGSLTDKEANIIYATVVSRIDSSMFGASQGAFNKTVQCAPSGSLKASGTVAGTSIDRNYDLSVTASFCDIVTVNATTDERTELIVGGGPISIKKSASGVFTTSGTLKWAASGGRGGSCTMTDGATVVCK